jgi:hypothetical protein
MLAGCATEFTPSSGGDGYSETQLSLTTFQGPNTGSGRTLTMPEPKT